VLKNLAARVFDLQDKKRATPALDEGQVRVLARNWYDWMESQPVEISFFEQEGLRLRGLAAAKREAAAAPPMTAPMIPGIGIGPPMIPGLP
jgi:hypothetical protein